ncbi:hypothetical protein ACJX0J_008398, partial [Zea mays]
MVYIKPLFIWYASHTLILTSEAVFSVLRAHILVSNLSKTEYPQIPYLDHGMLQVDFVYSITNKLYWVFLYTLGNFDGLRLAGWKDKETLSIFGGIFGKKEIGEFFKIPGMINLISYNTWWFCFFLVVREDAEILKNKLVISNLKNDICNLRERNNYFITYYIIITYKTKYIYGATWFLIPLDIFTLILMIYILYLL